MEKEKTTSNDLPVSKYSNETIQASKTFKLDPHLVSLLINEPFFSSIMRSITKVKSNDLPTAGVTVNNDEFTLFWNPLFLASLPKKHITGLLKHECYHLIFKHCTSRKQKPHFLWNIATDLAINSLISKNELPEGGLYPGMPLDLSKITNPETLKKWEKMSIFIEALPTRKSSEWYMNKIMNDEEMKDLMSSEGEGLAVDDHDGWGELSDEEKQIAEGKIKKAISKAVKKCDRTGKWGSVSAEMQNSLRSMISDSVNWRKGQSTPPVRNLHGGTSFDAVEKHVKKNIASFDGHIILTDGGASDPGPSLQRRCWVLLPGCKLPFNAHRNDIVVKMEHPQRAN